MKQNFCVGWLLVFAAMAASAPTHAAQPTVFAPGVISGPLDDASPAFAPDGRSMVFMRGSAGKWTLLESRPEAGKWSVPATVPFSGRWNDKDPAMAPNGSFLVFASNRPVAPGGKPLDASRNGKVYVGWGSNLWRVNRLRDGWSRPVRLPSTVNMSNVVFAPSVTNDGSIYFMASEDPDGAIRLFRSQYRNGRYLPSERVALGGAGDEIRDPAVAPDESFMVFSIVPAGSKQALRLAISYRRHGRWTQPNDLGNGTNDDGYALGAQLSPDQRILYFYSRRVDPAHPLDRRTWNNGSDNIWNVDLSPWLRAQPR